MYSLDDVASRDCQNCHTGRQGCTTQAALDRQPLSCTYLAHNELESIEIITTLLLVCCALAHTRCLQVCNCN